MTTTRDPRMQIMVDMEGGLIGPGITDAALLDYAATGFPASLRAIIERRDPEDIQ